MVLIDNINRERLTSDNHFVEVKIWYIIGSSSERLYMLSYIIDYAKFKTVKRVEPIFLN